MVLFIVSVFRIIFAVSSKRILILGMGYVGLSAALGFAHMGHHVVGVDKDIAKINKLNSLEPIIFENGLQELLKKHLLQTKNISFTTIDKAFDGKFDAIFVCVGTPQKENGEPDLSYIKIAYEQLAEYMGSDYNLIVTKSTVPPKSYQQFANIIKVKNKQANFDIAANPEFLRESNAIYDFLHPSRIIIGTNNKKSEDILRQIYQPLTDSGYRLINMQIIDAELAKYAANSFLAGKITFINELSHLCEQIGADIDIVSASMGLDERIGSKFLKAGPGYGGSCFPKDTKALYSYASAEGVKLDFLKAIMETNKNHINQIIEKLGYFFSQIVKEDMPIGVLGLAFKAGTDDIRESSAIKIIQHFVALGYNFVVFDPAAMNSAKQVLNDKVNFVNSVHDLLLKCETILIATEWQEFKDIDWQAVKSKYNTKAIADIRNITDINILKSTKYSYYCLGKAMMINED